MAWSQGWVEGLVENKGLEPVDTQEPEKHRGPVNHNTGTYARAYTHMLS